MSDSNRGDGDQALASQSNDASAEQKSASGDKQALNGDGGNITPLGEQSPSQPEPANTQSQTQTEQPEPHVLSDLIAQQEMADASIMMGWAAIGTLVITAIGTLFLAWQVKLTREAVSDTGEATKAMQRQTELIEQEQRPLLHFDSIAFEKTGIVDRDVSLVVGIKNFGRIPAVECKIEADWRFAVDHKEPSVWRLRECKTSHEIPQGKTIIISVVSSDTRYDDPAKVKETSGQAIYVRLSIEYQDRFGTRYGKMETYRKASGFGNRRSKDSADFRFHSSP